MTLNDYRVRPVHERISMVGARQVNVSVRRVQIPPQQPVHQDIDVLSVPVRRVAQGAFVREAEAGVEATGAGIVGFGPEPDAVQVPGVEAGVQDSPQGIAPQALAPAGGVADQDRDLGRGGGRGVLAQDDEPDGLTVEGFDDQGGGAAQAPLLLQVPLHPALDLGPGERLIGHPPARHHGRVVQPGEEQVVVAAVDGAEVGEIAADHDGDRGRRSAVERDGNVLGMGNQVSPVARG